MKHLKSILFPEMFADETRIKRATYYTLLLMSLIGLISMAYGLFNLFFGTTTGNNIPWI